MLDEQGNFSDPDTFEQTEDRGAEDGDASEVKATEAARKKARELGVQLSDVKGTGPGGRLLVKDVEKAAR